MVCFSPLDWFPLWVDLVLEISNRWLFCSLTTSNALVYSHLCFRRCLCFTRWLFWCSCPILFGDSFTVERIDKLQPPPWLPRWLFHWPCLRLLRILYRRRTHRDLTASSPPSFAKQLNFNLHQDCSRLFVIGMSVSHPPALKKATIYLSATSTTSSLARRRCPYLTLPSST